MINNIKYIKISRVEIQIFILHWIMKNMSFVISPRRPSGTEVIKLFSCSTQLSMKLQLLTKDKMLKNKDFSCFKTLKCCIYLANKC